MWVCLSANTGFLWPSQSIETKIDLARQCGFDGLEMHDCWRGADLESLGARLARARLTPVSLNTRMGDKFGCAGLAQFEREARADIEEAAAACRQMGFPGLHVVAGRLRDGGNCDCLERNLRHALAMHDGTVLIEPIGPAAMPDYVVGDLETARQLMDRIGVDRLKLIFDVYHIASVVGPERVVDVLHDQIGRIGHIQLAAWPDRNEPTDGLIDTTALLNAARRLGYCGAVGFEYRQGDAHDHDLTTRTVASIRDRIE